MTQVEWALGSYQNAIKWTNDDACNTCYEVENTVSNLHNWTSATRFAETHQDKIEEVTGERVSQLYPFPNAPRGQVGRTAGNAVLKKLAGKTICVRVPLPRTLSLPTTFLPMAIDDPYYINVPIMIPKNLEFPEDIPLPSFGGNLEQTFYLPKTTWCCDDEK